MRKYPLTILIAIFTLNGISCTIDELFPFNFGINKFQCKNIINQKGYYFKSKYEIESDDVYYKIPNSKDSTKISVLGYSKSKISCISESDNSHAVFKFSDDKLYLMRIFVSFKSTQFELLKTIINNIRTNISKLTEFQPESESIIYNGPESDDDREQIGEGYYFEKKNSSKQKPNWFSIEYTIRNKQEYDSKTNKYVSSEIYEFEIEYADLAVSKLDISLY